MMNNFDKNLLIVFRESTRSLTFPVMMNRWLILAMNFRRSTSIQLGLPCFVVIGIAAGVGIFPSSEILCEFDSDSDIGNGFGFVLSFVIQLQNKNVG